MARKGGANPQKTMSIMGHVQELQVRLIVSAAVLIVAASLAYVFRDAIIHVLLSPLGGQQLIYLNPAGGFSFILMVIIYAGIAVAAPVLIHQLYCFVRPTLPKKVQHNSVIVLVSSFILLISGVVFGYFFAIPGALDFLYEFAGDYVEASLTAESYINFMVAYTLGLGLVFQLPLLLMLVHWIKPQTPTGLMKSERWVIVLSFIAAAIITPTPDPINQTIVALPIILVYQLGVIAVLISIYKERRRKKKSLRVDNQKTTPTTLPAPAPQKALQQPTPVSPPLRPGLVTNTPLYTAANNITATQPRRYVDGFATQRRPASRPLSANPRSVSYDPYHHRTRSYRSALSLDGVRRAV